MRAAKGRSKQIKVFLDGKLALSLRGETAVNERLRVGQELSDDEVETLARSDQSQRCLESAIRYLSYRLRSEHEMKERLHQRGFDDDSIDVVINKLKGQGLIDDTAFTQFWKDNRETFSPRSQRLTKLELRRKGVAGDIIDEVIDTIDDSDSAYRAAQGKARRLPLTDYESFRRRLGGYLKRRGFGYEVTNNTVKRMWQELGGRFEDGVSP